MTEPEMLGCSICGMCRYRHDVVSIASLLPSDSEPLEQRKWRCAIGMNTFSRLANTLFPVVCVEHFKPRTFDRNGRPLGNPVPLSLSGAEIARNDLYLTEHAYSNLSAPFHSQLPGSIQDLEIRRASCSVCSTLVLRSRMVPHAADHCVELLRSLDRPCTQHAIRRTIYPLCSTYDVQFCFAEDVPPCGQCSIYRRFQHYALCELAEQATVCFPMFSFEACSFGPETPDLDARITFYVKPEYTFSRQSQRSRKEALPRPEPISYESQLTLADFLDETNNKNENIMSSSEPWIVKVRHARKVPIIMRRRKLAEPCSSTHSTEQLEPSKPVRSSVDDDRLLEQKRRKTHFEEPTPISHQTPTTLAGFLKDINHRNENIMSTNDPWVIRLQHGCPFRRSTSQNVKKRGPPLRKKLVEHCSSSKSIEDFEPMEPDRSSFDEQFVEQKPQISHFEEPDHNHLEPFSEQKPQNFLFDPDRYFKKEEIDDDPQPF